LVNKSYFKPQIFDFTAMNFLKDKQEIAIGMVLFPNFTQLDLTAPFEVFARIPQAKIFFLSIDLQPVYTDKGFAMLPNCTFDHCPDLDILFVGGGWGTGQIMEDSRYINFLQKQGKIALYITSVCTGALVLAAAGLLDGYKATTHWLSLNLLRLFDKIEVVEQRVVIDGNRLTGGGVTAGIDFGLVLVAEIFGESFAKEIQLMIEYNPQPPFESGSPQYATPDLLEKIAFQTHTVQEKRKEQIKRILNH
jgi:cyclohexyl-isocyanide hydratase